MDPALAAETLALSRQKALREALQRGDSAVSAFYQRSVVLITGGSGFLGKQLVEKLFRCTDVSKIYLLIRGKRGKSAHERLEKILKDPVYSTLHSETPDFKKKLVPVEGDVSQLKIGLSEEDWQTLSNEVNVIFHVAATVNFEEPIANATLTNVRGAREVVKLAKCCKHLRSIVHVSTAFSFATRSRVKSEVLEDFYKSPIEPEELIHLAETSNLERLEEIRNTIKSEWPNTYTFTKAVAEAVIRKEARDLPICIVRPAIVVAAFREPSPGWVDENNVYGASGLILGVTMGIIHTMQAESENHIDLVPVDVVNNALVVAAWEAAQSDQIRVYTVTNTRNPGTWDKMINTLQQDVRELISPRAVWYCGGTHTRHRTLFLLLSCLLHYIPALIADAGLKLVGQKARFISLYRKVGALSTVLSYFLLNDWIFRDDNLQQLYKKLSTTDRDLYNFDMTSVDYKELIILWHLGIRKFIVKDGLKDTQYGIKKQKWLKILTIILFPIYLYCLYQIFCVFASALYVTFSYLAVLLGVSSNVSVAVV